MSMFDVAIVGAGVFGSWTAYLLQRAGAKVVLIDAYGPANSRSSSGGESRIIRLGYGPDEVYTRSAQRSLKLWLEFFHQTSTTRLFRQTGVLWLAHETDHYCEATLSTLQKIGANCERFTHDDLSNRYPQLELGSVHWGILEPDAGILMARQAVQAVCTAAQAEGVTYVQQAVISPQPTKLLDSLATTSSESIHAAKFIFACGPWLPKLFPSLLGDLFYITRQEVFFFGVPPGDPRFNSGVLPTWIDFNDLVYGIPNVDNRGFKLAIDAHGAEFDPDSGERVVSAEGVAAARSALVKRLPAMTNAPVLESRVCQYENTSNGDFLIDAHPEMSNVWLVGGGSGHGFKHGPVVGEYVVRMLSGEGPQEPRFSLASKGKVQERRVY
jgi:monomeric sarcosine oxidase